MKIKINWAQVLAEFLRLAAAAISGGAAASAIVG